MAIPGHLVTVTVGPASRTVIPLATVKTELGITGSGSDTKLSRIIAAVGRVFAGPEGMRRAFWRQTLSEQSPGYGGQVLPLSHWPVESVTSVTLGTSTVTASTYSVAQQRKDGLYSSSGWTRTGRPALGGSISGIASYDLDYTTVYVGGWVMPDKISEWAASTAYSVGDFVESTDPADLLLFECTTAGTSASTEPTWPTTAAGTVTDSTVTWTARAAVKLPEDIQEMALATVMEWFKPGLSPAPPGIAEDAWDGGRIRYDTAATVGRVLPGAFSSALAEYR